MIDRVTIEQCSLCGACMDACPTASISFSKEHCGFFYPQIDSSKCVKCGRCAAVCPVLNLPAQTLPRNSYEAKNKNKELRISSSSGGVFSALAGFVIKNGGTVIGAQYDADWMVRHTLARDFCELSKLRGSKYVQSDTAGIYAKAFAELSLGRTVLFSGCPCQCAALRSFLKGKYYSGKLFIIDFVCHGILSETLFHEYLSFLEKKAKSKIISFQFRDKAYGWLDSGPKIVFKNGRTMSWPLYEDIYMQGYFQSICMKESCHSCFYKNFHSASDITMGDFWGADIIDPGFYEKQGVSLVLIQTAAGEDLFHNIKQDLNYKSLPLEKIAAYNQGIFRPFAAGEKRKAYFDLAEKMGYFYALKKTTRKSLYERAKRVYRKVRRKMKMK